MSSGRLLRVTFTISLITHGAILLPSPNFNPFTPAPKIQKIQVRYIKENPQAKPLPKFSSQSDLQRISTKSEPFLKLDAKIITGNRSTPPSYIQQENTPSELRVLSNKPSGFAKPAFTSPDLAAIKKKISLPPIQMAKINNPSYISYYQVVREKIRRSAYQNYTKNETGEVYISFIISSNGYLKDVHMIGEKTTANDYLKDVALRSVKDASPFPNFPGELDYPQLTFNIIISFEIE